MIRNEEERSRILLLNPPHPTGRGFTREGRCTQGAGVWGTQWPPLSLATTAALLRGDGHGVKVLDCPATGMDERALELLVGKFQPDFVFLNTATPTLPNDLTMAEVIRRAAPQAAIGVMGTHVTVMPQVALSSAPVDLVVHGEPEETIQEICRVSKESWDLVEGISFKEPKSGSIQRNSPRAFMAPEKIPSPDWSDLDLSPYRLPLRGTPFLMVAPVRGCPYPCSFCTAPLYYGKKLRKRPIEIVVDEMEESLHRFSVRDFFVWADTFTADKAYAEAFSREIMARRLDIAWTCNSRVDTIDRSLLSLMKQAGLWMISFGLESGNHVVLKHCNKRITVNQSKTAVNVAHELGIKTSGHFILGLPGEKQNSMEETLALALELPLDIAQFYAAAPFPGTPLFYEALEAGWLNEDGLFSQAFSTMALPGLSAHRVDLFRRHAYRSFYGRPKALLNLLAMVKPRAAKTILKSFLQFQNWTKAPGPA
ncbi:MAG: radical SAM protein [Deltaproteobacteria bacterium]|nr:radical SAM protein [Deltaproteobacteria bacterium]